MSENTTKVDSEAAPRGPAPWQQALPWAITIVCFGYLYTRLAGAAAQKFGHMRKIVAQRERIG